MTTTHTTESLTDIAFANVGAAPRGTTVPGYTARPAAVASDFQVGQVVAIYSRGNDRLAVIEKVGKKNVTVIYVTEGGIKDAQKFHANSLAIDPEASRKSAEAQARKNWDYHTGPAKPIWTPGDRLYDAAREAERAAEHEAKAVTFLAANPDREAYAKVHGQAAFDRAVAATERARKGGVRAYVNVTRKSVPFAQVGA